MPKCLICQSNFTIEPDDRIFYQKINVPEPVECPACRQQLRLCWRCERSLHFRPCDLCGRQHMSSYGAHTTFPVYCLDCWYGDSWNQLQNGRDFDFSRPFFEQWGELQKISARPSLFITQGTVFNSDYCNAVTAIKNCYLVFSAFECEDCYYSSFIRESYNLFDCTEVYSSERCYDCINCDQCYGVIASDNCKVCRDSAFLWDCHGCSDCLLCTNLRNQKFCINNQQLTEADYRAKRAQIDLRSKTIYDQSTQKLKELKKQAIHKYCQGFNNINCSGDYLTRCKNSKYAYDCFENEDCKYVTRLNSGKDCFDVDHFGSDGIELVYYTASSGTRSFNNKFCNQVWSTVQNMEYCDMCQNGSHDCFGCACLNKKQYCILNKQYSPEEYAKLKEKIIAHMRQTPYNGTGQAGEYGRFFPPHLSHVPYTDSFAQDYYPLTKEKALKLGFRWEDDDSKYQPASCPLPDDLNEIKNDITKEILVCTNCGKNYKIISQELEFYKTLNLPLPDQCFNCRLLVRLARKNPRVLYDHTCSKCGKMLKTTYSPNRPEKVYCEECYQKEIY
ncbi:MAG: hypothetical protein WC480_00665 [Patescibacteria group bacterium]